MAVGSVGAVGIGGAGAMSAGTETAATANAAGTASAGLVSGESNPVMNAEQLGSVSVESDFNTADLLIALLLMAAAGGKDEDDSSSTALGFLAGLALAGSLGRIDLQVNFNADGAAQPGGADGGVGAQLNVSV